MSRCDQYDFGTQEYHTCEAKVLMTMGKLDPQVTLEIKTNPRNENAENDFLKETLDLKIKKSNLVIHQRTTLGLFNSSGGEVEGYTILFEDIFNEDSGIIDTSLMQAPYERSTLRVYLNEKTYLYFSDCQFQWEQTPQEEEY